jgi:soluble lytic murein transglycosylase-like protein
MVAYPRVIPLSQAGKVLAAKALAGCAATLLLAAFPTTARAAEHITLRNGFDLVCDHREIAGDRVRLYMSATGANFLEVRPEEIQSSETVTVPAPPAPAPAASLPAPEPTAVEIREMTAQAGRAHDLDVELLASVIRAESGGNVHALSRAGARGLMQLMPGTADQLGVSDSFRADQNINGGTAYLNALLLRYHDNLALALAAYNAGPAAVEKYHGIPPYRETRLYVARIIQDFNRRKLAAARVAKSLVASATPALPSAAAGR